MPFNSPPPPPPPPPAVPLPALSIKSPLHSLPRASLGLPNNTLYCQNLNERIPLRLLKEYLQKEMSKYGTVLVVMARKSLSMRGQAFVVFEELKSAIAALESLQSTKLFSKRMIIKFANYKSHIISHKDGTFEIEERRRKSAVEQKGSNSTKRILRRVQIRNILCGNPVSMVAAEVSKTTSLFKTISPTTTSSSLNIPMSPSSSTSAYVANMDDPLINKILFIEDIPESFRGGRRALESVFEVFTGFVEVRTIPNRPKLAFVEYESEQKAAMAFKGLKEELESKGMRISYARK